MTSARPYADPGYLAGRERLRREAAHRVLICVICRRPIDASLRFPHPLSLSADHRHALADGGAADGPLDPAHLGCNSARGAATATRRRRARRRRYSFHEDPPGVVRGRR